MHIDPLHHMAEENLEAALLDPIAVPINGIEAQAILGLSKANYDIAVAIGLLDKSLTAEGRASPRTAHHSFIDLLTFILAMKRYDWNWIVSPDDIDLIVTRLREKHITNFDLTSEVDYFVQIGRVSDLMGDSPAGVEHDDALKSVVREIEMIWHNLFKEVEIELNTERGTAMPKVSKGQLLLLQKQVLQSIDHWQKKNEGSL